MLDDEFTFLNKPEPYILAVYSKIEVSDESFVNCRCQVQGWKQEVCSSKAVVADNVMSSSLYLALIALFVAQHEPTRKTPPLALLNPARCGLITQTRIFFFSVLKPEQLALFLRRGLSKKAPKGHRNPHSCSKMDTLFPRRKPPRQAQKGWKSTLALQNACPFSTPQTFKRASKPTLSLQRLCNDDFFWKSSGSATLFFQCFCSFSE